MIYLDNSATTKPCPEAIAAVQDAMTDNWANPSALYGFGIETARKLFFARSQIATALGAQNDRIYFTSGGTEADNWAIFGTVIPKAIRLPTALGRMQLKAANTVFSPSATIATTKALAAFSLLWTTRQA